MFSDDVQSLNIKSNLSVYTDKKMATCKECKEKKGFFELIEVVCSSCQKEIRHQRDVEQEEAMLKKDATAG